MIRKALVLVAVAAVVAVLGLPNLNSVDATGHSATRSFSADQVAPGGPLTVTITANLGGGFGAVVETLPDGFDYVATTFDDTVETDGQNVTFVLFNKPDPITVEYTVTASDTAGGYDFAGTVSDSDRDSRTIGGATRITVEGPSAVRSFSADSVSPGGELEVTITAANYGGFGQIMEMLPDGFDYVSTTFDGTVRPDGQTVTFALHEPSTTLTYTVTATTTTGSHTFSGTLSDTDRVTHAVGGDDSITVAAAAPTPTPKATAEPTVAPEEPTPTTDAVMVTNVRIGRVRETLITLSWDALEGAAGYKVQWKSGRLDWSEGRQLETSSTAITLRRLKPSTDYSVRVSATDVGTWSEAVTASTEGPDDDTGSPFPTMTPTPTATPEAPPPTPIPPTTMIATSTAATLMSADGTVTLELPADARSEAYQVNFESVSGCAYTGAKADVTFTCVKALIFDAEDMLETDVAFDAAPTISFQLSAEQVKALGGEFLLTKLHEMGGLMIITRASDSAGWTVLAGTTLTIDDETGGAVLAGWPSRLTSFTAVADQAAYDAIQEMYAHLLPRPMLAPPTGGPSIPGVALLALLLGSVALLSAGWILTARRSGA